MGFPVLYVLGEDFKMNEVPLNASIVHKDITKVKKKLHFVRLAIWVPL